MVLGSADLLYLKSWTCTGFFQLDLYVCSTAFCWAIWKTSNKAVLWTGLQNNSDKRNLLDGATMLQRTVVRAHEAVWTHTAGATLQITKAGENATSEESDDE